MYYIGIDLGTYLCRFVLAKAVGQRMQILQYKTIVVNFGAAQVGSTFSNRSLHRMEDAFEIFQSYIDRHVQRFGNQYQLRCVATAAFRFSNETQDIIDHIYKKFGIEIEIIESIEEIYLAALSCKQYIKKDTMIIDIGSGSIELAVVQCKPELKIKDYISLNLGLMNNVTDEQNRAAELAKLTDFVQKHSTYVQEILCSKCSALNIIYDHLRDRPPRRVMKKLKMEEISRTVIELNKLNLQNLNSMRHIGSNKTRLVRIGLPWIDIVLQYIGCSQVMLCETGLKEGIIMDMIINEKTQSSSMA